MTSELKPCPFCGEQPIAQSHKENNYFSYECSSEESKKLCCQIMPMTHIYNTDKEAAESWNTRAVPDVPELKRYNIVTNIHGWDHEECEYGDYVLYDQAAAVVAAEKQAAIDARNLLQYEKDQQWRERAEAAETKLAEWEKADRLVAKALWEDKVKELEAKLAQIEKQDAVGYVVYYAIKVGIGRVTIRQSKIMDRVSSVSCHREWLEEANKHQNHFVETVKVYTAPVSSDADLRAERDRYKQALTEISEEFELTTSRIRLRNIARAALNPSEQRT